MRIEFRVIKVPLISISIISILIYSIFAGITIYNKFDAKRKLQSLGISYTSEEFINAVEKNNIKVAQLFINTGIDTNTRSQTEGKHKDYTALMIAADRNEEEIVKLLLSNGKTDINLEAQEDEPQSMYVPDSGLSTQLAKYGQQYMGHTETWYDNTNALKLAIQQTNVDIANLILNKNPSLDIARSAQKVSNDWEFFNGISIGGVNNRDDNIDKIDSMLSNYIKTKDKSNS